MKSGMNCVGSLGGEARRVAPVETDPPEDVPGIVDRYITLIGKVVANLEARERESQEEGVSLRRQDVNSIVALGRTIVLLRASETSKVSRPDGKPVHELSTETLRALLRESETDEDE